MDRSELVDLFFWCVLFAAVTAFIGLYQCNTWEKFLLWVTFIGLGFDAIGALMLGLGEVPSIHKKMWPSMESARQQLTDGEDPLGPDDTGFDGMTEIAWEKRQIAKDYQDPDNVKITKFDYYVDGPVYAQVNGVRQEALGPKNQVGAWIEEKTHGWTRNKITPYALILLFSGFTLQLISFWLRNL